MRECSPRNAASTASLSARLDAARKPEFRRSPSHHGPAFDLRQSPRPAPGMPSADLQVLDERMGDDQEIGCQVDVEADPCSSAHNRWWLRAGKPPPIARLHHRPLPPSPGACPWSASWQASSGCLHPSVGWSLRLTPGWRLASAGWRRLLGSRGRAADSRPVAAPWRRRPVVLTDPALRLQWGNRSRRGPWRTGSRSRASRFS